MKPLKWILQFAVFLFFAAEVFFSRAESPTNSAAFKTVSINGAIGNLESSNGVFTLKNSGATDGVFFVYQSFRGNGQIIARVRQSVPGSGKIGLLYRQNLEAESLSAGTFLTSSNTIFERQADLKKTNVQTVGTNEITQWLRVVREGNAFSGYYSDDGTNWVQFSADTIEMPNEILAGIAALGPGGAIVEKFSISSASLTISSRIFVVPTNILMTVNLAQCGTRIRNVAFFADARKIGEVQQSPYSTNWVNAFAGTHSLAAKITDESGAAFFTEPVICQVELPAASAIFLREDSATKGKWNQEYGKDGFGIVRYATNIAEYAEIFIQEKSILLQWTDHPAALRLTNGNGGVASQWYSPTNLILTVKLLDGRFHQIALYCQEWGNNVWVQTIEAIDPSTGTVLDQRRAEKFQNGKYFVWRVRGTVAFRFTPHIGNAELSGFFLDSNPR